MEPLPAVGVGADRSWVRPARRADRLEPAPRPRGDQLRGARHRQHGAAAPRRHRRAEGAVAAPLLDGDDPVRLRDDRAGRGALGRHQHRDAGSSATATSTSSTAASGSPRRGRPALRGAHRDGQDRPRRRDPPAAVDGDRAARHPGRRRSAGRCPVFGQSGPARPHASPTSSTCGCRWPTCSARRAAASRPRRRGSARAGSTT